MRKAISVVVVVSVAAGVASWNRADAHAQNGGGRSIPSVGYAGCNRACLGGVITAYLSSLVWNDPRRAPLAANVRFTEDTVEMRVGEGFWKTASKLRSYRIDFLDVRHETAAVLAVMEEGDRPVLFAARLRVWNRYITEIETMVVRNQQEGARFAPDALTELSVAMTTIPPASQQTPREQMVQSALHYAAGLRAGSFLASDVRFAPGAYRLENGVRMAGPGCTFQPPSCENMRSQTILRLAEVKERVVAVDEENGLVLLRLDLGGGLLPGGAGRALVTFEGLKIYGGQVHAIEAVSKQMPPNTPSGWD